MSKTHLVSPATNKHYTLKVNLLSLSQVRAPVASCTHAISTLLRSARYKLSGRVGAEIFCRDLPQGVIKTADRFLQHRHCVAAEFEKRRLLWFSELAPLTLQIKELYTVWDLGFRV